jgi:hypothetical protein
MLIPNEIMPIILKHNCTIHYWCFGHYGYSWIDRCRTILMLLWAQKGGDAFEKPKPGACYANPKRRYILLSKNEKCILIYLIVCTEVEVSPVMTYADRIYKKGNLKWEVFIKCTAKFIKMWRICNKKINICWENNSSTSKSDLHASLLRIYNIFFHTFFFFLNF